MTQILTASVEAAGSDRAHPALDKDLDSLLSSCDIMSLPPGKAAGLRLEYIRSAVAWHIERNPRYAKYCASYGFDAAALREPADLGKVPLLPSALFKRGAATVSSAPADSDVLDTTSSGTRGTISVVPRDDHTLNRFFATVGVGTREILGQERSNLQVFNIGPLRAGHLWIAYVMSGVALFTSGRCYVEGDVFLQGQFLEDLRAAADTPVMVVGPPAIILDAARQAGRAGLRLHPESMIVSIGGWKRATGKMVPRAEFVETLLESFGLEDPSGIRDSFNMVELNTVLFECSAHRLHCPPWLHIDAREPRTLVPLAPGETGVLAFVDPTPTSYPGFVLSDDFGSVLRDHDCECGRVADILRIERRINRIEGRGCALKLDQGTSR